MTNLPKISQSQCKQRNWLILNKSSCWRQLSGKDDRRAEIMRQTLGDTIKTLFKGLLLHSIIKLPIKIFCHEWGILWEIHEYYTFTSCIVIVSNKLCLLNLILCDKLHGNYVFFSSGNCSFYFKCSPIFKCFCTKILIKVPTTREQWISTN